MMSQVKLLTCLLAFQALASVRAKVLLVSMDGFRWDYINKVDTPNFDVMAREGVRVPYINNTFITKTFPCHYSIATGLYEESHGIISNAMYDPVFNETFNMGSKESKWWDGGHPLWNLVQRHGLKSGVYYWPGSESEIRGLRPNIWRPYNETVPFRPRVDTVIGWLTDSTNVIDFAMLYFHEPDATGHQYGPNSQQVLDKVSEMDGILGYIFEKFNESNLWDTVNLIVTSDHGMAEIDPRNKSIDLSEHIDISAIAIMPDQGPITHILPVSGREDELYNNMSSLPHMRVFKKEDIPDDWHYKHNRRILPILGVADEGWLISKNLSSLPAYALAGRGTHGYDNHLSSMKPIFFAKGPNIKQNYTVSPFNSVDIYALVAELLGISPGPHNGTLENVKDFIIPTETNKGVVNRSVFLTWLLFAIVTVL